MSENVFILSPCLLVLAGYRILGWNFSKHGSYIDYFLPSVVAIENSRDILIPDPFNVIFFFPPWKLLDSPFFHKVFLVHDAVLKAMARPLLG